MSGRVVDRDEESGRVVDRERKRRGERERMWVETVKVRKRYGRDELMARSTGE